MRSEPVRIVQFDDKTYCIDTLADNLEYFAALRSSAAAGLGEDATVRFDMTHRGRAMGLVLDMVTGQTNRRELSPDNLFEMRPILDELLASRRWIEWTNGIFTEEHAAAAASDAERWEGTVCSWCGRINKWLCPDHELDWEARRNYCTCEYHRDFTGRRISRQEFLEEYYSNDTNRKHGSSTFDPNW